MAQSAAESRKTPFYVDAFWEKPTVTPPLFWDKWTQLWKLALLAKEGIQLDHLLNGPLSTVTYRTEPTYEKPVENHTQATERNRKVRNQQLKVIWQNRCKKIDEIGILCGDKPWGFCEQKSSSLLYLSIGTEWRRLFKSKQPHFQIEKEPFKELWQTVDDSFTKIRKITYDRFVFWSSKQQKGQSVESLYGRLIEQAEKFQPRGWGNYSNQRHIYTYVGPWYSKWIVERNCFTYKGIRGSNRNGNEGTKSGENKWKFENSYHKLIWCC